MPKIEKFLMRDSDYKDEVIALVTYLVDSNKLIIEPIVPKTKKRLGNYPFALQMTILKGQKQLTEENTKGWLSERVVPPERPGILESLHRHGIKEYNAIEIMKICHGKNAMDGTYWEPVSSTMTVDEINKFIKEKKI